MSKHAAVELVLCGCDGVLLNTRGLVLEKAGFQVTTTHGLDGLNPLRHKTDIRLFVLCHTLGSEGQERAAQMIQTGWPSSKLLLLSGRTTYVPPCFASIDVFAGPEALIKACHRLSTDGLVVSSPAANLCQV